MHTTLGLKGIVVTDITVLSHWKVFRDNNTLQLSSPMVRTPSVTLLKTCLKLSRRSHSFQKHIHGGWPLSFSFYHRFAWKTMHRRHFLLIKMFFCYFILFYFYSVTIVCIFYPSLHPTPASPTSLPHLYPPP